MSSVKSTAVVAGDLLIDWSVAADAEMLTAARSWKEAGRVHRHDRPGGAWLAAELINAFAKDVSDWTIEVSPPVDPELLAQTHKTHSLLSLAPDGVWRIDRFLGIERAHPAQTPPMPGSVADADLLVVLDSGLGFTASATLPPRNNAKKPWIVLKSGEPDFSTSFGKELLDAHAERLIIVMTADDLRRTEVQVSRRLSWERTAQESVKAVRESPVLAALRGRGQAIVSFGAAGAVVIRGAQAKLVFDPSVMEGEWEKANHGMMIGGSTVLTAAVAYELMTQSDHPSLTRAITRGIAGMRALFNHGYGRSGGGLGSIRFPLRHIVKETLAGSVTVSTVEVDESPNWTALSNYIDEEAKNLHDTTPEDYLHQLASAVAVFSPEEMLIGVPHLKIGDLFTADRSEIEAYQSIKSLLNEYVSRRPKKPKPFSIAVFGPPGSGKSFGVEEIANKALPGADIQKLTFNLTQFDDPDELNGAFHQVRDVALSGKVPLVFWDEFDTIQGGDALGWLRHFIGPMQDGVFQEGPLSHPIGKSIFVFAGGTCSTWAEFSTWRPKFEQQRRDLKVPDFISRVRGHLDVLGPNQRKRAPDRHFVLRRAILLRSMLLRDVPNLFVTEDKRKILQIEREVLCAFLHAKDYKFGARSIEAIIAMSALSGRKSFDRSSLPPAPQRAMHVAEFDCPRVTNRHWGDDLITIERLAEQAHQIFLIIRRRHDWKFGVERNDEERIHDLLVDYGALPWSAKNANRDTVRKIPEKLKAIGAVVVPAGADPPRELTPEEIEILAPIEHDIWWERKKKQGFKFGKPTTDDPLKSLYMTPWKDLPEEFKETDREMVKAIPRMLAQAGFTFVPAGSRPHGGGFLGFFRRRA